MQYVSQEAWNIFEKKHRDAYYFLLRESLKGELAYLESLSNPNAWEKNRREELRQHFATLAEIEKNVTNMI